MALAAAEVRLDGLIVPEQNAAEAAVVEGIAVYPVGSLAEAVGFLAGDGTRIVRRAAGHSNSTAPQPGLWDSDGGRGSARSPLRLTAPEAQRCSKTCDSGLTSDAASWSKG
jgi:predicted ATPase with chaperone activity